MSWEKYSILNPETIELSFFIDAIGLETFLMLLEIQVIATMGMFLNTTIKPIFTYIKYFYARHVLMFSWNYIKDPGSIMLVVPSPATLMGTLVFFVGLENLVFRPLFLDLI